MRERYPLHCGTCSRDWKDCICTPEDLTWHDWRSVPQVAPSANADRNNNEAKHTSHTSLQAHTTTNTGTGRPGL